MVDEFKVPVSPEWGEICGDLKHREQEITTEDIKACRDQLLGPLWEVYEGMSEQRQKTLAALAEKTDKVLKAIGNLSGEPETYPKIRDDLNFLLLGRKK